MSTTVDFLYPATIAVGHRVEVRWYEAPVGGFFGTTPKVVEHEPQVIDLDTGVEYAPGWMYTESQGLRPGRIQELMGAPRDGLREVRKVSGVVRSSRVLSWSMGDGSTFVQTTLILDDEE